jgi:hypothetical protein
MALECIQRDYTGPEPLFNGKQFDVMFRISKERFERIMQDIGRLQHPFYTNIVDGRGKVGASFEARLMLPLRTMAYGVAPHAFSDYFQMSETQSRECCKVFDQVIRDLYSSEYLRKPTKADLKSLSKLHKSVHRFPGMFGSLDCMHTFWKNCPVAWQGSYKGNEKKASIVLEAISDYHMWFWHAGYGYAGALNDTTILSLSPFMSSLLDGTFDELESDAVPFKIGTDEFKKMYILVDGIYPRYTRFVHSIKEPANKTQEKYTGWQEASRKDIERAFAVLKGKWQCLARPIHMFDLNMIGNRVACCLILHNMCVSDRVMENVYRTYDPAFHLRSAF